MQGEVDVMRKTVCFGAATGLPSLFPVVAITVPQPPSRRPGARVVAKFDPRRREDGSSVSQCMSDGTIASSRRPTSGEGR